MYHLQSECLLKHIMFFLFESNSIFRITLNLMSQNQIKLKIIPYKFYKPRDLHHHILHTVWTQTLFSALVAFSFSLTFLPIFLFIFFAKFLEQKQKHILFWVLLIITFVCNSSAPSWLLLIAVVCLDVCAGKKG